MDALGVRHVRLRELPSSPEPAVAHATCKERLQRIIERNQDMERKIAHIERKEGLLKTECDHLIADISHNVKEKRQRYQKLIEYRKRQKQELQQKQLDGDL